MAIINYEKEFRTWLKEQAAKNDSVITFQDLSTTQDSEYVILTAGQLKSFVTKEREQASLEARIDEINMTLEIKGASVVGGVIFEPGSIEGIDKDVIYPSMLKTRLAQLQSTQSGEEVSTSENT